MRAALSAGSAPATTRSGGIPTARPTDAATAGASPVTSHDLDAGVGEQADRLGRGRPDRVGDDDHAGERAIDRDEDGCPRLRGGRRDRRAEGGIRGRGVDPVVLEQAVVAREHDVAVDGRFDAVAGPRGERRHRPEPELVALGAGDDRRAERVLAAALRGGRQVEEHGDVRAVGRHDVDDLRPAHRSACRSCRR